MLIYLFVLFVVLTPGVLLSLPPKSKLLTKALVHGLVFVIVYHFTHKLVWKMTHKIYEGATGSQPAKKTTTTTAK